MKGKEGQNICLALMVSIACMIVGIALLNIMGRGMPQQTPDQIYMRDIIPRVAVALGLILFMRIAYKEVMLGFWKKGFFQGLGISFLMDIYIIVNFMDGASVDTLVRMDQIAPHTYVLALLSTMAVGLFEEVLLRGTVLNIIWSYLKEWKYGIYASVFGSSLLFGLVHMMNYFSGNAYLRPTIAQVFYATFLGLFLGAVYVKSKNLWVVILLHGLFDFAAEFWELVTPNYDFSKQDISWGEVSYMILSYLPLAIAAIYITWRAVKEKETRLTRQE